MGPSGAGKSTLMDILAMRKSVGQLTGQLLLNGHPATRSFIRKTAYVPQVGDDSTGLTPTYQWVLQPSSVAHKPSTERILDVESI
jgi:ABC-type multidrug transport system ATPase subunit